MQFVWVPKTIKNISSGDLSSLDQNISGAWVWVCLPYFFVYPFSLTWILFWSIVRHVFGFGDTSHLWTHRNKHFPRWNEVHQLLVFRSSSIQDKMMVVAVLSQVNTELSRLWMLLKCHDVMMQTIAWKLFDR